MRKIRVLLEKQKKINGERPAGDHRTLDQYGDPLSRKEVGTMSQEVALEIKGLTKQFPGVVANEDVNLTIEKGEIRAIMGENGAGKSTLCNMITGLLPPTKGEIFFEGKKVEFRHPKDALAVGIRMVYQDRNLIAYLTGTQSICLGLEDRKRKYFIDEKKMHERTAAICRDIGADVPLNVPIEELSVAEQQMIEIIRAVAHDPKLLILDEPTASLGSAEVEILFGVMRRLKESGVAIMIITHKLDEVFEISDTITILRNGRLVDTVKNGTVDRMEVARMMIGKDVSSQFPAVVNTAKKEKVLEIQSLTDEQERICNINLDVHRGEVVGIYGLLGSGRTEILESVYGLRGIKEGKVILNGKKCPNKKESGDMVKRGVLLIPEDRRHLSVFRDFYTIRENVSIGYLDKISNRFGMISKKKEKELFKNITSREDLRVKFARDDQDIEELSGGNQQKLVLGRWIYRDNLELLLMDEPTHGIDVGVKYDIYVLIRNLAAKGKGILVVSSELPELTGICDRLYIIKEGLFKGELKREEFENERILEMVL